MSKITIVLLVILAVLLIALVVLYFLGKKAQKKQAEQEEMIAAAAQQVNILVIDKGKMKLKDAGFPSVVLENTPKYLRRSKVPVVKAKVGPKIMTLMCDASIYDLIPVKKEVNATEISKPPTSALLDFFAVKYIAKQAPKTPNIITGKNPVINCPEAGSPGKPNFALTKNLLRSPFAEFPACPV